MNSNPEEVLLGDTEVLANTSKVGNGLEILLCKNALAHMAGLHAALSQSALQRVVVVFKALQFEEVLRAFTLLTGGQVCDLDCGWRHFR